jgi:predicted dehydrogenase
MSSKTNLAIIGSGYMGKIYQKACRELSNQHGVETYYKHGLPELLREFELKAIADRSFASDPPEEADGIRRFASVEEMLKAEELGINAAVIATPISTHAEIAEKLIRKGISLLIEKPVCETAREVKHLIYLSKKYQVRIMPGHVERYNPVTLDAMEAVRYRIYGKVVNYTISRTSPKPERVKDSLIIDKLIHDLDLIQCIFGTFTISDVKTEKISNRVMKCVVHTEHKKGYSGEIISSWLTPEKERKITIEFERGLLDGDFLEKKLRIDRYMELTKQVSCYQNNQIKDQLVDFIAYKHKLIKTLVNIHDALRSAYLIDEINERINNEV